MEKEIEVKKYNSTKELFSEEKLLSSIRNAGISRSLEKKAISHVKAKLYSGISTKEIHTLIVAFLNKNNSHIVPRYNLKQSIMQLGPTGYPFEKYIGRIFESLGYSVEVGKIVHGKCVDHEVDVIATKDRVHYMIECKFHNHRGYKTNVRVPLYIKSRFEDIEAVWVKRKGHEKKLHQAWIVTNTKFTTEAIKFGECSNIKLLGWGYPKDASLEKIIDKTGLHPITCLTSLTKQEKAVLLEEDIVLCTDLHGLEAQSTATKFLIKPEKLTAALKEAEFICGR